MIEVSTADGKKFFLPVLKKQDSLARTIWLSGKVAARPLCAGVGQCGNCRVRFLSTPPAALDEEYRILGADAVAKGWRLACRHAAIDGMAVEVPEEKTGRPLSETPCKTVSPKDQVLATEEEGRLILAVDLGTTSIQWQLIVAEDRGEVSGMPLPRKTADDGRIVASGSALNPQMGAGSDVLSRVAVALSPEGRRLLRNLVLQLLNRLVREAPGPVDEICVAGNTAMTAILLDRDVSGLAAAPCTLPEKGGSTVMLPGLPFAWIPPQPAPFVGGDLSAGMAVLLYARQTPFPFVLADMGTNGEFVLALNERESLVTSVPLGPSLEGMGLTHGGMAGPGSVSAFRLEPTGLSCSVLGGGQPETICGTGYLSLLNILLRCGFLTHEGKPVAAPGSPLARKLVQMLENDASGVWKLPLVGKLSLSGVDVEELLKVKAAFSLALETLLAAAGLRSGEIACFVLGGALGEKAPTDALENLGFLPQGAGGRTLAAGNTSLAGAKLLLQRPELRKEIIDWSTRCRVLDLMSQPTFTGDYVRHMVWGQV